MTKPTAEQTAWVFKHLAESINDGGSSFRHLIYDRMGYSQDDYRMLYRAGGRVVTNCIIDGINNESEEK